MSTPTAAPSQVITVEPADLAAELNGDHAPILIDVRDSWEFAQGALPGALHLPLAQLVGDVGGAVGVAKDQAIVTYCHHGVRSHHAAQALSAAGYTHVRSLTGGTERWSLTVDSSLGRY